MNGSPGDQASARTPRGAWCVAAAASICIVVLLAYMARQPLLIGAAHALTIDDAAAPADYLVVPGGSAEDRPFAAAELYELRIAPKVLLFEYPGDSRQRVGGDLSQTELYRRVLELQGVPRIAVETVPGVVRSSWDEARMLRRFLAGRPISRVVVVTSAEHTRRARWTFRQTLGDLGIDVRTSPARRLTFDETNWWRHDEGVLVYLHEYLKLPYYVVRYGFAPAAG